MYVRITCVAALGISIASVVASCLMQSDGAQIITASIGLAAAFVATGLLLDQPPSRKARVARKRALEAT